MRRNFNSNLVLVYSFSSSNLKVSIDVLDVNNLIVPLVKYFNSFVHVHAFISHYILGSFQSVHYMFGDLFFSSKDIFVTKMRLVH